MKILDRGNANLPLAFLSGLTLLLLPANAKDELTMTTVLRDKTGNELGTYTKSQQLSTWIQLFLVFATPVSIAKSDDYIYELGLATLQEAFPAGGP